MEEGRIVWMADKIGTVKYEWVYSCAQDWGKKGNMEMKRLGGFKAVFQNFWE